MANEKLTNGPAAAAILASGIGSAVYGLFINLTEISKGFKSLMNLYDPVGPLSGKTLFAVIVWLLAWLVLNIMWKNRSVDFARVFIVTLVLIAIGFIGSFPPVFLAWSH